MCKSDFHTSHTLFAEFGNLVVVFSFNYTLMYILIQLCSKPPHSQTRKSWWNQEFMASSATNLHYSTCPIKQVIIVAYEKLDIALQNMVLEDLNPKRRQGCGAEFWRLAQYHDGLWPTTIKKIPIYKSKKRDAIMKGRVVMKMQPYYDPRKWECKSPSQMQLC